MSATKQTKNTPGKRSPLKKGTLMRMENKNARALADVHNGESGVIVGAHLQPNRTDGGTY